MKLFFIMCVYSLSVYNLNAMPEKENITILYTNRTSRTKDSKNVEAGDEEKLVFILSKLEKSPYYNPKKRVNQRIKIYIILKEEEISIFNITSWRIRKSSAYYILPDDLYEELIGICKKYVESWPSKGVLK